MLGKFHHGPEIHWGPDRALKVSFLGSCGSGDEKATGATAAMAKRNDLREGMVIS